MKTTVVPAQITTVEDKIAGNLNFTQLLLLIAPIFLGGAIYAFMPPVISYTFLKTVVIVLLAIVCITLAIRIKGRLVLEWIGIKSRYNIRPKIYIYDKNDIYLRKTDKEETASQMKTKTVRKTKPKFEPATKLPKLVQIEHMITDPKADFHFKANRKGGLSVHIKEVK